MSLFKKISTNPQGGELILKGTSLGEYGILLGGERVIKMAIWWDSKDDMVNDLKKVINALEAPGPVDIDPDRGGPVVDLGLDDIEESGQ